MGVEFTCQPELKDGRAGRAARARERERGVPPPRPGFQQLKRLADRLTPISRNPVFPRLRSTTFPVSARIPTFSSV